MTAIAELLNRLDKVRQTSQRTWLAACPAHEDGRPSLAIREAEDGRLLVHCFGGCHTCDVLAAVGLKLMDLFPRPLGHRLQPMRSRHNQHCCQALALLAREAVVVLLAAHDVIGDKVLDEADRKRLCDSVRRIRESFEAVGIKLEDGK